MRHGRTGPFNAVLATAEERRLPPLPIHARRRCELTKYDLAEVYNGGTVHTILEIDSHLLRFEWLLPNKTHKCSLALFTLTLATLALILKSWAYKIPQARSIISLRP